MDKPFSMQIKCVTTDGIHFQQSTLLLCMT
jgi:hypothetical protein